MRLIDLEPVMSPDDLVANLVPPPRFRDVRFASFRPARAEPTQATAVGVLAQAAVKIAGPAARAGLFRKRRTEPAGGIYLDGGFGVGKTHLLAALWHAVPGPKAYGTFVEYTHLIGALGFAETVRRLSGYRLFAVDEFELDDPGDTMLMTRLLMRLSDTGVFLAATSNTVPDRLGQGRFAAEDFRREIHALAARFRTVGIDGPDYRHSGLAGAPAPLADPELAVAAEQSGGSATVSLDGFAELTGRLAQLHPSRYGRLVDGTAAVHLRGVAALPDQAAALRWVVLIDRLYDRSIPVRYSGVPLDGLFTADMLRGGYRKKYLRALSRIVALSREGTDG